MAGSFEHGNGHSGTIKDIEILGQPKKSPAP
jgi:hypothetical protein